MKKTLEKVSKIIHQPEHDIRANIHRGNGGISFYGNSINKIENALIAMARDTHHRYLMVLSTREDGVISKFTGEQIGGDGIFARKCPLDSANAEVIRELFPWTKPVSLRNKKTTIGCGDRLGIANPGHIAAVRHFKVSPVLAQQSMRELELTKRTYREVVNDTTFAVYQSGYKDGYGADGDHLKTIADINLALEAGMPMITLDLSDVMNAAAGEWSDSEIDNAFDRLSAAKKKHVTETYFNKQFLLNNCSITIDMQTAKRCAVMYLKAMDFAARVHNHLKRMRGKDFDLEISIDETTTPTLPEHHLFIVNELIHRKVKFTSLAPRFIGEFQKAIDYIGNVEEFTKQLESHCAIASNYGNYKISVHSGSDKFAVYPIIGKLTSLRCHVKTAGTSWLEAVRVIAERDPVLYRVMHKHALKHFDRILKLYHITADITKIPQVDSLYDEELPQLMEMPEARQLLHITYGPILCDHTIRPLFFDALHTEEEYYHERIMLHFQKHLSLLGIPKIV